MKKLNAIQLLACFSLIVLLTAFKSDNAVPRVRKDNMTLGNPSNATTDATKKFNYLMVKTDYTLSFNDSLGYPNWVSWHLDSAWIGDNDRSNKFAADRTVPAGFFMVSPNDYKNTGYDKGHVCPSAHRTATESENIETFLMTNMFPQAPNLNQQTWRFLEDYCRINIVESGNECYSIAGGYGSGGESSKGGVHKSIGSGKINVPAYCWKIVLILPEGADDIDRIDTNTRVIAVLMPNMQDVKKKKWWEYRVSVDSLETLTKFDFLSNVPEGIQRVIEAKIDNGPAK